MIDINELRRLAQAATPGPDGVSLNWLKLLQDFQKEANPAVINELLDRLEAAESDALEQARLNGMGASREAALMAKLEAAEKERDELRAEIAAMKRQEPVAWARKLGLDLLSFGCVTDLNYRPSDIPESSYIPLYLAPGAQPAPSIPDGWKLVPIEPTPEMIDAAEYVDWGDADVRGSCINAWDRMLAAAPEAKP